MKKLRLFVTAAVAALLGVVATQSATYASTMEEILKRGEIRVAVQTQGPPISFVDAKGERTGLAIEIVQMMANDAGLKVVLQDYDWKGLIPAILSGKADLIAADMTPTAKRSTRLIFTNPIFFTENIAFSTKEKGFTKWQDLNKASVSIGATQASTYADAVKAFMPVANLKEFAGGTAATMQAVMSGRVDAGVTDTGSIKGYFSEYPNLVVLEGALSKEPLAFAARPDSLHLMFFMNNYVGLIRHDGRLGKLVNYWWTTTDWEKDHK